MNSWIVDVKCLYGFLILFYHLAWYSLCDINHWIRLVSSQFLSFLNFFLCCYFQSSLKEEEKVFGLVCDINISKQKYVQYLCSYPDFCLFTVCLSKHHEKESTKQHFFVAEWPAVLLLYFVKLSNWLIKRLKVFTL